MSNLVEALKQKIDSKEKWEDIRTRFGYQMASSFSVPGHDGGARTVDKSFWWAYREHARLAHKVYETTEVLERVNITSHHFLHISTEDRQMVAYTPDAQAGEKDKQIKTSLGRYLSKFYPLLTDHFIQNLVAEHLSDLSSEIEFLEGSEAIVNGYLNGVHSCMAKEFGDQGHPAAVYGTPDIAMAVLRDAQGKINARAMVVKSRKVYIRHYGDTKLLKRLTKNGYTRGNWVGSEFKLIPYRHAAFTNTITMPYLDANGGAGGPQHSTVAIIDGKLKVIDYNTAMKIQNTLGSEYAVCCTTTAGYIAIEPVPSGAFKVTDAVTGEQFDLLAHEDVQEVFVNRKKGSTRVQGYMLEEMGFIRAEDPIAGRFYYADKRSCFRKYATHGAWLIDTDQMRKRYSFVKLDAAIYGERSWARDTEAVILAGSTSYVLRKDAIAMVQPRDSSVVEPNSSDQNEVTYVHNTTDVSKLRKLHAQTKGAKVYASPAVKTYKTPTGRTVAFGYNEIVTDIFGAVDFERNCRTINLLGDWVWCRKDFDVSRLRAGGDIWKEHFIKKMASDVGEAPNRERAFIYMMDSYIGNLYATYNGFGLWAYEYPWTRKAWVTNLKDAVRALRESANERAANNPDSSEAWIITTLNNYYDCLQAEAEAVEAPVYLRDTPQAVIEVTEQEPELVA